jgi:hypothetical protein
MDPVDQLRMFAWFEGFTEEMPTIHYRPSQNKQQDIRAFLDREMPEWREMQRSQSQKKSQSNTKASKQ